MPLLPNTHPNPQTQLEEEEEEMVKFSKQFEGQLVPEWKEAFVDYKQLKKDVKKIQVLGASQAPANNPQQQSPHLVQRLLSPLKKLPLFGPYGHKEPGVIQVHRKLASSASRGDVYETELLEQFADTDAAKEFFARLDLQLNKVNQFYKGKEKEFVERGDCLRKQMEILLELKAAMKQQRGGGSSRNGSRDDPSISCSITCDDESNKGQRDHEQGQGSPVCECESEELAQFSDSPPRPDDLEKGLNAKGVEEGSRLRSLSSRRFSCQGKNLKINIPLTNPSRTISALSYLVWGDMVSQSKNKCGTEVGKLNINKTKLQHAEKMIRGAYVELFKGLGYLSTYRNLNMLAFVKILKKFDKVTGKQVLPIYLKVVESSYFNSSDMSIRLMDEVEELFVKHFAGDDKRKAVKYLKPHQRKESHSVTFFIGNYFGPPSTTLLPIKMELAYEE